MFFSCGARKLLCDWPKPERTLVLFLPPKKNKHLLAEYVLASTFGGYLKSPIDLNLLVFRHWEEAEKNPRENIQSPHWRTLILWGNSAKHSSVMWPKPYYLTKKSVKLQTKASPQTPFAGGALLCYPSAWNYLLPRDTWLLLSTFPNGGLWECSKFLSLWLWCNLQLIFW